MNIQELKELCKSRDLFTAILLILVGAASFGLGRLSKIEDLKKPVSVENAPAAVAEASIPENQNASPDKPIVGGVVGSKLSKKYHLPWCSGAKQLSPANSVWFASPEEARKAGYVPALNCKGIR